MYLRNVFTKLFLILIAYALPANGALLNGKTVTVDYLYPDLGTTYATETVTVGSGVEILTLPSDFPILSVDLSDLQILITFISPISFVEFNAILISDINTSISDFTSVTVNPSSTLSNANVSFNADSITVFLDGLTAGAADTLLLDINNPSGPSIATPEPSSFLLAAAGLLGVLRAAKSRR